MFRPHNKLLTLLIAALLSPIAAALEDDRSQPIRISADQALRDEKQGVTVYSGNVKMDQGSLYISADKITIFRIVDEADKIVAQGKPAHLQQRPEPDKGLIHAEADTIEYYKAESRIHLRESARLQQDGSTVTGATIEYYIDEQRIVAGSERTEEDRVRVVIEANTLQQDEGASGDTEGK